MRFGYLVNNVQNGHFIASLDVDRKNPWAV